MDQEDINEIKTELAKLPKDKEFFIMLGEEIAVSMQMLADENNIDDQKEFAILLNKPHAVELLSWLLGVNEESLADTLLSMTDVLSSDEQEAKNDNNELTDLGDIIHEQAS